MLIMKQLSKQIKHRTHWAKLKSLTEQQIMKAARSDPDAQPLTQAELKQFKRVHPPKTANVRHIRLRLHLSQIEFAHYFGVSERTIQEWEQGRRRPTATARNFLKVIEREPKAVLRALSNS